MGDGESARAGVASSVGWLRREPLLWFLVAGALLFALFRWRAAETDPATVHVGETELLKYLQYRGRRFDAELSAQTLHKMSVAELQALIDDYVREEALVREARRRLLDRNDYVIRQRLVQKLEFVSGGFDAPASAVTDEELSAYYTRHSRDYLREPRLTFAHVYISHETREVAAALELAERTREQLNKDAVAFNEASQHGERFLYHVYYVDRSVAEIESQFGAEFAAALTGLPTSALSWSGPLRSRHGHHLVLLTQYERGGVAEFADVRAEVEADVLRERRAAKIKQNTDRLLDAYKVVIDDELPVHR